MGPKKKHKASRAPEFSNQTLVAMFRTTFQARPHACQMTMISDAKLASIHSQGSSRFCTRLGERISPHGNSVWPTRVLPRRRSKPLQIWDSQSSNGHIKRITDEDIQSSVLEIVGTNVATNYISCPGSPSQTLGIKLPFLVLVVKNLDVSLDPGIGLALEITLLWFMTRNTSLLK